LWLCSAVRIYVIHTPDAKRLSVGSLCSTQGSWLSDTHLCSSFWACLLGGSSQADRLGGGLSSAPAVCGSCTQTESLVAALRQRAAAQGHQWVLYTGEGASTRTEYETQRKDN
jgi:hypothetical protein